MSSFHNKLLKSSLFVDCWRKAYKQLDVQYLLFCSVWKIMHKYTYVLQVEVVLKKTQRGIHKFFPLGKIEETALCTRGSCVLLRSWYSETEVADLCHDRGRTSGSRSSVP